MPLNHNAAVIAVAFSGPRRRRLDEDRGRHRPALGSGHGRVGPGRAVRPLGPGRHRCRDRRRRDRPGASTPSAWDQKWNRPSAPWVACRDPERLPRRNETKTAVFKTVKEPRMSHQRWESVTRRAALALLPWLCLATVGPWLLASRAGVARSGKGTPRPTQKRWRDRPRQPATPGGAAGSRSIRRPQEPRPL